MKYTADFETTTNPNDCRVWAWAICEINESNRINMGIDIESFIQCIKKLRNPTLYFHNLKFDGYFIVDFLLKNGYKFVEKLDKEPKSFTTVITEVGAWYNITIQFTAANKCTIYDSLKILNMSVDQIAKSFNLDCQKLEIDYNETREPGHELTADEKAYLANDVIITAKALGVMFSQSLTKMTIASDALTNFKQTIAKWEWDEYFPILDPNVDKLIRDSYRGGFTYVNPRYQGRDISNMITLDVNSLYPSVMYYCKLPVGEPHYFKGAYQYDSAMPLYLQNITCNFELKQGYLPTIQLKGNPRFTGAEYLSESGCEPVTMSLTNIDLQLFLEHYDVYNMQFNYGYKFRAERFVFNNYIDHWMSVKERATQENNSGLRVLSKLMLNSLYGKFGKNPIQGSKYPTLVNERVELKNAPPAHVDGIYIPLATFITAHARAKTITHAQSVIERFVYADTDSCHLIGEDLPDWDIHPTKLGAWALEEQGYTGRYIRPKTYIHWDKSGLLQIKACGMSKGCYNGVTIHNFHYGTEYTGKLRPRVVPGGVVLEECTFTIK